MDSLSKKTLHFPVVVALICVVAGLSSGLVAQNLLGMAMFGRFGAVTTALGIMTFGATASDLLIEAQAGKWTDESGDLPYPYSRRNLRKVLGMQTVVVMIGTIQWGFGDLVRL